MGLKISGGELMISGDGVKEDGVEDQWEKIREVRGDVYHWFYVLLLMFRVILYWQNSLTDCLCNFFMW